MKNNRYKKRTIGNKLVSMLFRPFMRIKLKNKKVIDEADFPVVFVCNHNEYYGPLSTAVALPYEFRPWIDDHVLDKKKIKEFVNKNTLEKDKNMPRIIKKLYLLIAQRYGVWAFNSINPIPIRRESLSDVKQTIDESVEALINGSNILIFPENPANEADGRYKTDGISEFYSGFANIGTAYYKKTGKALSFYPLYANKYKHTMEFGNAVKYKYNSNSTLERKRITQELYKEMLELSKF